MRYNSKPPCLDQPDLATCKGIPLISVSLNQKYLRSRTQSPKILAITSSAFGPCTAKGETSGSNTFTFKPLSAAIALENNTMLLSAIDSQKRVSESFNNIGSLIITPS